MNIEVNETEICTSDLPNEINKASDSLTDNLNNISNDLQSAMDKFEKQFIKRVYESYNKNKTWAAKALKISIQNLYYKIRD